MSQSLEALVRLILPEGILDYFEVTNIHQEPKEIWIYLEETNTIPVEYANDKLVSKGFLPESSIQDFPVRGKAVYLFVKRRRWHNSTTGQIVTRNWDLVCEGTRMTTEFASFWFDPQENQEQNTSLSPKKMLQLFNSFIKF